MMPKLVLEKTIRIDGPNIIDVPKQIQLMLSNMLKAGAPSLESIVTETKQQTDLTVLVTMTYYFV